MYDKNIVCPIDYCIGFNPSAMFQEETISQERACRDEPIVYFFDAEFM